MSDAVHPNPKPSMRRFVVAPIVAAIALFVWGGVFWGVLYDPLEVFSPRPLDPAVVAALQADATPTGTYFFPWPRNTPATRDAWLAGHRQGPFFKLSYVAAGVDPQSPRKLATGAVHNLVVAVIATAILGLAATGATSYRRRFFIVFLAGAMGTVFIQVGDPIWFHLPWDFVNGVVVYEGGSWLILATILAALVRPRRESADAAA